MTEASLRIEGSSSESFVEVDWLHQQPVYAAWSSDSGWTVASSPRDLHRAGHPGGLEWARVLAQPLPSDWPLGFAAYERGVHVLASGQGYFLDRTGSVHPSGLLATRSDRSEPLTVATLDDRLRSSVRALKGRRVGLLLSGGLDSGLLAALLADESVPYAAACVADPENVRDVQHAVTLCAELGVDLTVVEPSMEDYLAALPVASSAFEDARPDVFRAMGLIFGAHALKTHRCDVVIGGEPADDVLGSSRVFFDASSDAHRAHLWRECLRDTTPRSIHLLRGAARLLAAEAAVPYADPRLVRAASATAWGALQDTSAVTRGPGLSGPGFKPLQKRVARALPVRALQEICAETKLGLPHSSQSHWLALKMLLGSSSDHETFRRMWRLSALLYEATVCDGQPPEAVPAAQIIDGISRNLVDVRKSVQVPQ